MTNLPERLRQLAESLNDWDNPITAREDCLNAAKELERLQAIVDKLPKTTDRYMIVSVKHGYVGNDFLLWGANGHGYTTDIDIAGVFSANEALQIHSPAHGHFMVPCLWVVENCTRVLESQRCKGLCKVMEISKKSAEAARKAADKPSIGIEGQCGDLP